MTRHALARWAALALLLSGCNEAHGREDDGGGGGADAGPLRDAGRADAGGTRDAGAPRPCDAEDAAAALCPETECDGPPTWHWNGDDCVPISCGTCVGADCARASSSADACWAAHAQCAPARCRTTGGEWRFWGPACGHFVCGAEPPAICEAPVPVCDCGPRRRFDEAAGCVAEPSCPVGPPAREPEAACLATGGTWGDFCCHSECGERCLEDCVTPACDCGSGRVFESDGCVARARCFEGRREGEICDGDARCMPGLICCERCGGAGCFGPARCQRAVCDDDPDTDLCGNDLLAP